ncbi:MAG TPA: ATP-binding protein [Anaeromyxobacteraceae bacterium]|nr:ATP-binding protein [Anaeromyxobacteraceae bacterium]
MDQKPTPVATKLRRLASALGVAVAALGALVLVGWAFHVGFLTRLVPSALPMKANTAAALLAAGAALALCAVGRPGGVPHRVGQGLAAAVVALSALTLLEHGGLASFALDELLVHDPAGGAAPGRMSAGTAVTLLLLGLALLSLDAETRTGYRPAQVLAVTAGLVPLQATVGWIYGVEAAQGQSPLSQVALHGGLAFGALCVGVLCARPERGVMRIVASPGPAGFMARRLLVVIALLPIVLGWLFLVAGLRAGQYEAMVGASLVVVSAIVTGAVVVWGNAREIQRIDEGRTAVEEALRAEREWFRTTLGSIGDAVIAADASGRVSEVNAVAEALTGWRRTEALGAPMDAVFRSRSGEAGTVESPFGRVYREARVADLPPGTVLLARSGAEFPVEGCVAPIRDGRGVPQGVVLVFRDIRERRRVEEERADLLARERSARAEAEEASRAKDEFIATLSHELRTPLNSVLGWARLLRMGKLDAPGIRRAVEAIERGATTQAQIVDDLLDMARIVRGQLRLDVRPLEMVTVIEAALDTVRPAAAAREIELASVLEPRAGTVAGDPGRLQQVVWNLLTNAIKFTPPGGRAEVRLERQGEAIEVSVRDTGPGIPSDFLPHVFERFRQGDSSTTRAHGGLGLGLAIVRHIVEAHGGSVEAESPGPGLGSTFRVRLPVAQARPRARDAEAPRPASRPAPVLVAVPSLLALRVLIVDDDRDTLEVVKQLLEQSGADVTAAASAEEALDVLRRAPPDVLLSDIGMPGQDGYELIRRVRQLAPEQGGRVPAAALTAFAHGEHRQQALSAGFQLYLPKPIEPAELTAAVARLAGRAA